MSMGLAILGGLASIGSAIYGNVKAKKKREAEAKKIEAQRGNLKAINDYKNKMFDYQNQSILNQFNQAQKSINMASNVTRINRETAVRQNAGMAVANSRLARDQVSNMAMQNQDAIGSAVQASSVSGFRGTGSSGNLKAKQSQVGKSAMENMQNQMRLAQAQSLMSSANAYSQSNVQLAQYAQEKEAQEQNKNLAIAQLNEQRQFENDQYYANDKQLADTGTYLSDSSNFIGDDLMNIAGATFNAGMSIAGAYQQDKSVEDQMAFQAEQAERDRQHRTWLAMDERANAEKIRINNQNFQMEMLDKSMEQNQQSAMFAYMLEHDASFRNKYMAKYNLNSVR